MDNEQKLFEKWMADNEMPLHECIYTGRYQTPEVRMAWTAWQARAELAEAELARIAQAHRSNGKLCTKA